MGHYLTHFIMAAALIIFGIANVQLLRERVDMQHTINVLTHNSGDYRLQRDYCRETR